MEIETLCIKGIFQKSIFIFTHRGNCMAKRDGKITPLLKLLKHREAFLSLVAFQSGDKQGAFLDIDLWQFPNFIFPAAVASADRCH